MATNGQNTKISILLFNWIDWIIIKEVFNIRFRLMDKQITCIQEVETGQRKAGKEGWQRKVSWISFLRGHKCLTLSLAEQRTQHIQVA